MTDVAPSRFQRFEVLGVIGTGGMGRVYRARDPQLDRVVAIKVLADAVEAPDLSDDTTIDLRGDAPPTRDELLREARVMAQLSHPNVLAVYEVGLADSAVFLVMEHIEGQDLETWMATPRDTAAILEVFVQAGRGLVAAHERGIVHRDFKPANVLIGVDGRVRVADFGLSKLVDRSAAMVRLDDGRGTPRYMAPELWLGAPATLASDVFAYCTALDQMLGGDSVDTPIAERDRRWRERGVSSRLRSLLAAGLAEDPEARPPLATIVAGLHHRRSSRARWFAIAGAAVGVAGVVTVLALTRGAAPACDLEPQLFAGIWDAARRTELRTVLARADPKNSDKALAAFDAREHDVLAAFQAACVARRDGALTDAQAEIRRSCLMRRVYAFDAVVAGLLATREYKPGLASARVREVFDSEDCRTMTAPPLPAAPSPVVALYRRYYEASALAGPSHEPEVERRLTAVLADADKLGEHELASRTAVALATTQRFLGKLDAADASLARAYKTASEIHFDWFAVEALVDRSDLASQRGDVEAAKSYAELARDVGINNAAIGERLRSRIYWRLGTTEAMSGGDYKAATANLRKALALAAKAMPDGSQEEWGIRLALVQLLDRDNQPSKAVELARETVERMAKALGEHAPQYGVALATLADAQSANNDRTGAIATGRRALAVMKATLPPTHSMHTQERLGVARFLIDAGKFAEGYAEVSKVAKQTAIDPNLRALRTDALATRAEAAFELGRFDEARKLRARTVEEAIAIVGLSHPATLSARRRQLDTLIEVGDLDAADAVAETLDAAYRTKTPDRQGQARYELEASALARMHGNAAEAERHARTALGSWTELGGDRSTSGSMHRGLGLALLAGGKPDQARVELSRALDLARETHARADAIAALEIDLGCADIALGHRDDALPRIRAARAVLAEFPGQVIARGEADRVLGDSTKRRPRPRGRRRRR